MCMCLLILWFVFVLRSDYFKYLFRFKYLSSLSLFRSTPPHPTPLHPTPLNFAPRARAVPVTHGGGSVLSYEY